MLSRWVSVIGLRVGDLPGSRSGTRPWQTRGKALPPNFGYQRAQSSTMSAEQSKKRGAFIVFEGCDRSGKTTQVSMLVDALNKEGMASKMWRFPGEWARSATLTFVSFIWSLAEMGRSYSAAVAGDADQLVAAREGNRYLI